MFAEFVLPVGQVPGILILAVDHRHPGRAAQAKNFHLGPIDVTQRPRTVDHKDHPGPGRHRPEQFAVIAKGRIVAVRRKKSRQHAFLRPLIVLQPLQGLARILETGGIDETDDLPAVDAHRKGLTDHRFRREWG